MKKFSIYQVNDEAENARYIKYSGLDFVRENFKLTLDIYNKVYEGEFDQRGHETDVYKVLENLYHIFNVNHPEGFKGHSLSVSDIVEIDGKFYYCDDYGWQEVEFDKAA